MKTKIITFALFATFLSWTSFAQDRTTVTATGSDISDNLDLKAVASIFGDSQNLEDFEQRLNDPKIQISNLDLNGDNQVDYLRVIESVEGNTHLIIVQSVLDRDVYQDVATIEVERDNNNNRVQVQVVGNVYMYGQNYIYEPVYINTPVIYSRFWVNNYNPYVSAWYWNYYPTYYYGWTPYPVYRYRRNVHVHINVHNHYNYVNNRRSTTAVALYNGRRNNGYERQYPNRSFERRNANVSNRYELDQTRRTAAVSTRNTTPANQTRTTTRNYDAGNQAAATRANTPVRTDNAARANISTRNNAVNTTNAVRNQSAGVRSSVPSDVAVRNNNSAVRAQQQSAVRTNVNTDRSARANSNSVRSSVQTNAPSRVSSIPQQFQRQQQVQRPQQSAARSNPAPAANRVRSENTSNSSSRR